MIKKKSINLFIVNIHLLFNDNVKLTDMNTTLQQPIQSVVTNGHMK